MATKKKMKKLGTNVRVSVKDKFLTIKINLSKTFGSSKSGKTIMIASTRGNHRVPGAKETVLSVNCYKYPDAQEPDEDEDEED